jgi:hypothetical protein
MDAELDACLGISRRDLFLAHLVGAQVTKNGLGMVSRDTVATALRIAKEMERACGQDNCSPMPTGQGSDFEGDGND